jgi:hypothetical protein
MAIRNAAKADARIIALAERLAAVQAERDKVGDEIDRREDALIAAGVPRPLDLPRTLSDKAITRAIDGVQAVAAERGENANDAREYLEQQRRDWHAWKRRARTLTLERKQRALRREERRIGDTMTRVPVQSVAGITIKAAELIAAVRVGMGDLTDAMATGLARDLARLCASDAPQARAYLKNTLAAI